VSVESNIGKGSTFTITIPLHIAEEKNSFDDSTDNSIDIKNIKILLAEDNIINQKLYLTILTKSGAEVVIADNGKEAINQLKKGEFDIVLMDVQMPVMDGITATEKIRKTGNKIPIIALTANAFKEDIDKCLKAGMNDFISKPIKMNKFISIIYSNLVK
jgi:two-component system, sensor histidine kinase